LDETYQRRLPQHFRGALIIILHHRRAHSLSSADPTADTYQNNQVLVAMRLHRRFHFVLCRLQFFLKRIPLVVLGKLVDAVAAAEHVLAYAQRLRQFDNVGPDVLNLLAVLCSTAMKPSAIRLPRLSAIWGRFL